MRRIKRHDLDGRTASYLARRQKAISRSNDVQTMWNSARRTTALQNVLCALQNMAGKRRRCFFCEDSRGTDIEHFWPKARYPERAFDWLNLLLACTGCNRRKGTQFPLDPNGHPLLIDPTSDEPWEHLFFEPRTGEVVARWDPAREAPDPKGTATTDSNLLPLNDEAVTEGRKRVHRRLERAVRHYLSLSRGSTAGPDALRDLFDAVMDNDEYGVSIWCFVHGGRNTAPFNELREKDVGAWNEVVRLVITD